MFTTCSNRGTAKMKCYIAFDQGSFLLVFNDVALYNIKYFSFYGNIESLFLGERSIP